MQIESKGRSQAQLEVLLLIPPRPRLRNLFPGVIVPAPTCDQSWMLSQRESITGFSGGGGGGGGGIIGSMPYPLLGGETRPAAAKAWAKLMQIHEKQQREQREKDAEADALSSSF